MGSSVYNADRVLKVPQVMLMCSQGPTHCSKGHGRTEEIQSGEGGEGELCVIWVLGCFLGQLTFKETKK